MTKSKVEQTQTRTYNYREVKIRSVLDAHLTYDGEVSGRHYEWVHPGDIQSVDERDAPYLLSKRIGQRSCCGEGLLGNLVFEQLE